jgi:hypothetical protein
MGAIKRHAKAIVVSAAEAGGSLIDVIVIG